MFRIDQFDRIYINMLWHVLKYIHKGFTADPPTQCSSGAQYPRVLILAAGGHYNDACLLRYQRTCFMRESTMYDAVQEGKVEIPINIY